MVRRQSGTTLAELLVSLGIFSLLLTTIFVLFALGSRGFYSVENHQGVQGQLAAIRAAINADLIPTNFYGFAVDNSNSFLVDETPEPRYAFSAVSVRDWSQVSPLNAYGTTNQFGMPAWDRWVVYRVTNERKGQLARHVIRPSGGAAGRVLLRAADGLGTLAGQTEVYKSSWSGGIESTSVLAHDVRSLTVKLDPVNRSIELAITLVKDADRNSPRADVLTASFFVQPKNTVPTD